MPVDLVHLIESYSTEAGGQAAATQTVPERGRPLSVCPRVYRAGAGVEDYNGCQSFCTPYRPRASKALKVVCEHTGVVRNVPAPPAKAAIYDLHITVPALPRSKKVYSSTVPPTGSDFSCNDPENIFTILLLPQRATTPTRTRIPRCR